MVIVTKWLKEYLISLSILSNRNPPYWSSMTYSVEGLKLKNSIGHFRKLLIKHIPIYPIAPTFEAQSILSIGSV